MKDTQLALPHNDPKKMGTTAKVSAKELEDFESFIKIINTLLNAFCHETSFILKYEKTPVKRVLRA